MNPSPSIRANYFATAIMIGVALLIIADRTDLWPALHGPASQLYLWGVILGAFALALGALNVGWLHTKRILDGETNWIYSVALVAALLAVLVGGLINPAGVQSPLVDWIFQAIIQPGQATLFALLIFFMASAAFLFLRTTREGGGWILVGALLMLTAQVPVAGVWMPPSVSGLIAWSLDVPGMAALRGVLLGGSIAALVVAVRFIITSK